MRLHAHADTTPSRSASSERTGDLPRPAASPGTHRRGARGLTRLPLLVLILLLVASVNLLYRGVAGLLGAPA